MAYRWHIPSTLPTTARLQPTQPTALFPPQPLPCALAYAGAAPRACARDSFVCPVRKWMYVCVPAARPPLCLHAGAIQPGRLVLCLLLCPAPLQPVALPLQRNPSIPDSPQSSLPPALRRTPTVGAPAKPPLTRRDPGRRCGWPSCGALWLHARPHPPHHTKAVPAAMQTHFDRRVPPPPLACQP